MIKTRAIFKKKKKKYKPLTNITQLKNVSLKKMVKNITKRFVSILTFNKFFQYLTTNFIKCLQTNT